MNFFSVIHVEANRVDAGERIVGIEHKLQVFDGIAMVVVIEIRIMNGMWHFRCRRFDNTKSFRTREVELLAIDDTFPYGIMESSRIDCTSGKIDECPNRSTFTDEELLFALLQIDAEITHAEHVGIALYPCLYDDFIIIGWQIVGYDSQSGEYPSSIVLLNEHVGLQAKSTCAHACCLQDIVLKVT